MLIPNIILGTAMAASNDWCSTGIPSPEFLATVSSLQAAERSAPQVYRRQNLTTPTINVPVYITGVVNTTNSDDILSDAVLQAQFDVIADRFARYDITFTLQNKTRIVDDDLAKGFDDNNWSGFKAQNRKGDYATLNLFYVTNMDDTTWGTGSCTVPAESPGTLGLLLDGCTMAAYSTPGGVLNGKTYLGEVTVHEIGHWFSLLHTFDGEDCTGPGDYIDDTPAESVWQLNVCPLGRDSCPDQPGLDPINNYMDYAGEGCWTQFTEGQKVRMHNAYWTLRASQNTTVARRTL